jgi:hypothetical protein
MPLTTRPIFPPCRRSCARCSRRRPWRSPPSARPACISRRRWPTRRPAPRVWRRCCARCAAPGSGHARRSSIPTSSLWRSRRSRPPSPRRRPATTTALRRRRGRRTLRSGRSPSARCRPTCRASSGSSSPRTSAAPAAAGRWSGSARTVPIGSTSCRRRFGCSSRSGRATPVPRAGRASRRRRRPRI